MGVDVSEIPLPDEKLNKVIEKGENETIEILHKIPLPDEKLIKAAEKKTNELLHSYKDLVARRCAEKGILFAPTVPAKWVEGKQIYRVGNTFIYIYKTAIFVQQSSSSSDKWIPQSLNNLLESAL